MSEGSKSQSSQNGELNQNRANEILEMERRQEAEIDGFITHMRYGLYMENVEYWKGYKNDWVVHYHEEIPSRPEGTRKDNLGNDQGRGEITQP